MTIRNEVKITASWVQVPPILLEASHFSLLGFVLLGNNNYIYALSNLTTNETIS